mgnify:CR=1 FL=1
MIYHRPMSASFGKHAILSWLLKVTWWLPSRMLLQTLLNSKSFLETVLPSQR